MLTYVLDICHVLIEIQVELIDDIEGNVRSPGFVQSQRKTTSLENQLESEVRRHAK